MDKKQKILLFIGISFSAVLLTAFILTITGAIDLTIVSTAEVSPLISYFGCLLLFLINMFFIFSISLLIFDSRIIKILLLFIPFYMISNAVFDIQMISSTLTPFIYCLIVSHLNKINIKKTIINFGLFTLILCFYQIISIIIKIGIFEFGYNNVNILTAFIFSIDLYLMYTLIYMVVKNNVEFLRRPSSKFLISSEKESIQRNEKTSNENVDKLDLSDLSKRQLIIFQFMNIAFALFQLIVVLSIGKINDRFIELLIILIVFWIGRIIMKKSYHSDSLIKCSIITFGGFYLLTKITLPLSISLFFCIALSALFVCILYKIAIYTEKYDEMHDTLYEFDLNTCSVYRLTERCRLVGMSEEDTHFCIDAFFKKKRNKELAELYEHRFANLEVIKYQKNKLKKKLNSI